MTTQELIYDVEVEFKEYVIYITDISNIILEYIKDNYDCKIYKKDYSYLEDDIYKFKIYFNYDFDHDHEQLIIYLRDNGYKYAKSF